MGAHVVAPWMVEKIVNVRCNLGLQHIQHFIDHRQADIGGDRLTIQAGFDSQIDFLTGGVLRLIGRDFHRDLWRGDDDACVAKGELIVLNIRRRKGHIRRHVFGHRHRHAPLLWGDVLGF